MLRELHPWNRVFAPQVCTYLGKSCAASAVVRGGRIPHVWGNSPVEERGR
jgi:hypothetical protein